MSRPSTPSVAEVTARIVERSSAEPRGVPRAASDAAGRARPGPRPAGLRQPRPRLRRLRRRRTSRRCAAAPSPTSRSCRAYNDMLSAHQPFETYPRELKKAVIRAGGIAQFAGGVPAMCDGITQGRDGMQLSLFSRDVIAMSTAIALSHDMFDGALMLGVCDKIVPGLLIGALSFGHLPDGVRARRADDLRAAERREGADPPAVRRGQGRPRGAARGRGGVVPLGRHLHVLRHRELQPAADGGDGPAPARLVLRQPRHPAARGADPRPPARGSTALTRQGGEYTPIGEIVDEKAIVNACVALLASRRLDQPHACTWSRSPGPRASTLTWDDLSDLSAVVPLLTRGSTPTARRT